MIFTRQIFSWILCCTVLANAQFIPLSSIGDDNDCALYLSGPGRTSAFDYNLNLLRGSFPYDGQHTCITYDAVNAAYIDARKRINVAAPKGDWKTEDIASVGELILDISISLARTYGLTYEDIEKGLPLIDTAKTLIREVCPPFLSHVDCRAGKYRRFDGLCTNLRNPTWGASMTPFQRLLAPLYADGINAPRISVTGNDLPLARIVSRTMHPDEGFHDHAGTVMVIAWGQFMDHDYTLTGTPLDPFNRNDPEECCNRPPHQKHPYCNELRIPDDDYFYRLFNVKCIDFVRAFPSPRVGCKLGSRAQFNTLTGVLDGNTVYGVTEKFARKLRSGYGGLLRMNPVFEEYGLKDLLPLKLDIPDEGCTRPNKSMYCFEAGEIRVNEQLVLTCMHTLMAREHNRVARGLAHVNPHWDDETLFQESRRIVIAEIQHITYNEFLPILLGKEVMEKFGLVLQKNGYWDGYDDNINPNVIDAFAAAAFRFGHSLLPTSIERWSKAHKFIASKRLSDLIRRPYDLYRAGIFDEYLMGLMNQVAQAMDDSITQEVTNHLFKKPGKRFGMDLVSFNMQRGREFGLPGYMEFRKFCGLPGASTFEELFGSMPNDTIQKYESIFEHPSDVDLWSGGVSERPLPGSMLGPTFACVIATQFSYSRRGDRFWYELPNQPSSFTPEQLQELRKARLSRIICDNTDIIDTVQVYPMVLPDHEINPRVPCRSGVIPSIDFTKWADYNPQHHSIPTNPYERETKADITSTSDKSNGTVVQKTIGHYKNALRRKRNVVSVESTSTVPSPANNDSQTAAIIVTQVTGSHPNNDDAIVTTESAVPSDQREDTSPQSFAPKLENSDSDKDYYIGFDDDYDQVSRQPDGRTSNGDEEPIIYNGERFITDEKLPLYKDDNEEEEIERSDGDNANGKQENTGNEEFVGNEKLEHARIVDENNTGSSFENDNKSDHKTDRQSGTGSADSPGNSDEHGEGTVRRDPKNDSEGLDWIAKHYDDDYEEVKELDKNNNNNENLKEQFEHIPLDYKHDDAQEEKNIETEDYKNPLNIDLGDTTVELENITLPDDVLSLYKSDFVEKSLNEDNKNSKIQKESDDDEENNGDEDEEENDEYFTDEDYYSKYALLKDDDKEIVPPYAEFDARLKEIKKASEEDTDSYLNEYIKDTNLRGAVASLIDKSKKVEEEAGSDEDPVYNYSWSLEYGQPV